MATNDYGKRPDGSNKGSGYFGELQRSDGDFSTEVSIGVNIDGKEVEIPSLVPGLDGMEIGAVLADQMPDSVVQKAVDHAKGRISEGKSPFFEDGKDERPWEKTWGEVTKQVDIVKEAAPQIAKTIAPWAMSFGSTLEAPVRAVKAITGMVKGTDMDGVFNRLIGAESGGVHRNADGTLLTSPVGAQGIAQVMPKTSKRPGYGVTPAKDDSEEESLRFGKDYLQAMVSNYNGDMQKAVAAYNAGPGSVDKAIKLGGDKWIQYLPKRSETIPYMNKVLGTNHQIERRG